MTNVLKILIAEDKQPWMEAIELHLLEILSELRVPNTIDRRTNFEDAKKAIRDAGTAPYDLISLDIHFEQPEVAGDGLTLLRDINKYGAGWLVAVMTGVETDQSVENSLGPERARIVQQDLRARAYASFPPDRLLVLEKPPIDSELLESRIRQVCTILIQSLTTRNVFRRIELPCEVAMHETVDGKWVRRASSECSELKEANKLKMKSASSDATRPRIQDAKWFDDMIAWRQIRFGCGEMITVADSPNFQTIEWLLERPGQQHVAEAIRVDADRGGDDAAAREHDSAEDYAQYDELGEDPQDPQIAAEKDYEAALHIRAGGEWDTTDRDTRKVYEATSRRLAAELESTKNDARRKKLLDDIGVLKEQIKSLRRGAVPSLTHEGVKKHKSRAIATLKEAGQLDLAAHLEESIEIKGGKIGYDPGPGYTWNT